MGRIAELFEKKALGTATAEELKELDTLQKEAQAAAADGGADDDGAGTDGGDEDEDAAVDKLAQKLADAASSKIEASLKGVLDGIEVGKGADDSEGKPKAGFIVDKMHGKKTLKEAETIMVKIAGREKKTFKEASLKTIHFVKALIEGDVQKLQLLVEGTGSRGGFLVPEEFANMIVEDIRDESIMRQIAAPAIPISGDTLHLPGLASRPKAKFRGETEHKNTSTVDLRENVFTPYSLAVIVGLSNELADDASLGVNGSIVNYVAGLMAQSIREREETAFWVGGGVGEPTGVMNYSLRTIAAGGTDSSKADAVIKAFRRTPQGYRNRGVFVANSSTLEILDTLKNSQGDYLVSNLANSPTSTLKGRPVYEQNDLPGGVLLFGDFGYYQIVDRMGIQVRISDEATVAGKSAFEDNLTYVRVEERVDGELVLPDAVTKVTGL